MGTGINIVAARAGKYLARTHRGVTTGVNGAFSYLQPPGSGAEAAAANRTPWVGHRGSHCRGEGATGQTSQPPPAARAAPRHTTPSRRQSERRRVLVARRALQLTPPWASDGTKLPRLVRQETPGGLADAPCSWGGVRKNTSKQVCSTCGRSSPVATAFVQCKADGTVPPGALSAKIQQAKDAIEDALGGLWEDTRVWLEGPSRSPRGSTRNHSPETILDMNQVTQPREGTRSGAQESLAGADGSP